MRLCEIKQKEVINICDCQKLGNVADVDIDICTGHVTHIIVPGPCKIWGMFGRENEYVIDWRCIKQIGEDVILVEVNTEKVLVKCNW